jgi:hypothetical protein
MTKHLPWIVLAISLPWAFSVRSAAVQNQLTFSENVAPIIFDKCAGCHRPGEAAPFSLLNYDDVRKRAKLIATVTQSRYMPPWSATSEMGAFRDDRRLSDGQIRTIQQWIDGGMVEGDPRKLPALREFTPGWQLGKPDLVLKMNEPFELPPDGPDVFRNFAIKLNLKKDQWVKAVEFRSTARASHHALFFLDQSGQAVKMDEADPSPGFAGMSFLGTATVAAGNTAGRGALLQRLQNRNLLDVARASLGGWAVGGVPQPLPEGLARPLPQESDFVLQMHFHPTGKVEKEQATIGLYYADGPPKRTLTALQLPPLFGALAGIDIPAGEKHFVIRDSFILPIDVEVVSVGGHAHYLAKTMHMTATLPGGSSRELVGIPDWKFNWQERYFFKDFVKLPKGTRLDVEIAYDNSRDNVSNPNNPLRRVTFGQQSTDEMGAVTIEMVAANEKDLPEYANAVQQHIQEAVLGRVVSGLQGPRR